MLEIFIAILLALGSPVSKTTTTSGSDGVTTYTQSGDNDNDTGGEGGHIPPTP